MLHRTTRLALLLCGIAAAGTARADLRVCNHSGVRTKVAVVERQQGALVSRGWWTLEPFGGCASPVRGALRERLFWVYGYDDEGMEVAGEDRFCVVTTRAFSLLDPDQRCEGQGRDWRGFVELDAAGQADFTFDIHDFHFAPAAR